MYHQTFSTIITFFVFLYCQAAIHSVEMIACECPALFQYLNHISDDDSDGLISSLGHSLQSKDKVIQVSPFKMDY